jgi:hypothetical protein
MPGTAVETHKIKRMLNGVLQRGTVQRDTAVYPNADAAWLQLVNQSKFSITLESGQVLPGIDYSSNYSFQGIVQGGYPSNDERVLKSTHRFINGMIEITGDLGNPGGGEEKYFVNCRWLSRSQYVGSKHPPTLPILVQKFIVPSGRPEFGNSTGVRGWRDNPVTNASELIRYL